MSNYTNLPILSLDEAEVLLDRVHTLDFGCMEPYGDIDGFITRRNWTMRHGGHDVRVQAFPNADRSWKVYASVSHGEKWNSLGECEKKIAAKPYWDPTIEEITEVAQEAARCAWDEALESIAYWDARAAEEKEAEAEAEAERVCEVKADGHDVVELVGLVMDLRDMVSTMGLAMARYDSRFGADRYFWENISSKIPSRCKAILERNDLPVDVRLGMVK